MIKRKVILIASPGDCLADTFLKGVIFDIQNMISFLTSPSGGSWDRSEIQILNDPDKTLLLNSINENKNAIDYQLVLYSGHGLFSKENKETVLLINEDEVISDKDLIAEGIPKQLIIVDSCRTIIDASFNIYLSENVKQFPSMLTNEDARKIYDSQIEKCDSGTTIVYSSSIGQVSKDTSIGGLFLNSLFEVTDGWIKAPNQYTILPISSAVVKTTKHLKSIESEQVPKIKNSLLFPFALRSKEDIV